jgi:peptidoglycan/xylan/chitin deacetylase (PgdA/CDA1 family)
MGYLAARTGFAWVLRQVFRNRLTVLAYHRISGPPCDEDTFFEPSLYSCSATVLEQQLRLLQRMRSIVSLDDVCDAFDGVRQLPSRPALVTFDDATFDHYSRAFPILRRMSVPAVFFVGTRSLMERCVEWWNLLGYAIRAAQPGEFDLGEFGGRVALNDPTSRERLIRTMTRLLKLQRTEADVLPIVEEIATRLRVSLPDKQLQDRALLSNLQLKEMLKAGMTIGSHTHSHPFLRRLVPSEQLDEMTKSKVVLERLLGTRVRGVAYPYGQRTDYNAYSQQAARDAGYEVGFNLSKGRIVSISASHRFDIDRFPACARANFEFEAAISAVAV